MLLAQIGIVAAAHTVSAGVGAPLVGWALRRVDPGTASSGVLRGGTWIGLLERLAVTGALLAGFPEAIAVVIAVKGLGRYPELRSTDAESRGPAAERFIIGTLASFLWAAAIALLARAGLDALA